jgi:hypothetical protein
MSYVDKQIAAYRKTMGDAVAGKGLQKAINRRSSILASEST